jgi:ligand-binding SRPBCC domain-containing protein
LARIELLTVIAAPCERCFDLARSVDLHLRSTSHTSESAIGGRISGLMTLGDDVTWRARHFGVWFTLTSRITEYDRPNHFRDRMVRGPLARLDHSHEFADDRRGGTAMCDVFDFAAPAGPLGRAVEVLLLNAYFKRFMERRNQTLKAVAESDAWRQFIPANVDG